MNIIIKETQERQELSIIDPKSGVDYTQDFIGNTGALIDGQFVYDEDRGAYVCDQGTFEWWDEVTIANQALNYRIYNLGKKHGYETVYRVIEDNVGGDLEGQDVVINEALDQAFGVDDE